MVRLKPIVFVLLAGIVLAGCTHTRHRATAEAAYYDAQARAQAERAPIVELVAQPGEAITLQGVERFAVYAPEGSEGVRQYQSGPNPWVQALGILGDVGLKGYGVHQLAEFATSAVTNAGGNTSISNSGRMASPGDTAGGDLIHGDRIDNSGRIGSPGHDGNSGRIGSDGDDIAGDRIDNTGRWHSPGDDRDGSPGPIDESGNCRDGGDCSADPPDGPPDGEG